MGLRMDERVGWISQLGTLPGLDPSSSHFLEKGVRATHGDIRDY